jgi:cytochrome c5
MLGCYQTGSRSANARVDRRLFSTTMPGRSLTVLVCYFVVSIIPQIASAQGPESGKKVVEAECAACHRTGVNGAPKIGERQAWAKFTPQGLSKLTELALTGIRKMPPHGGNPDLTNTEIERAITYMVNQSGGYWIEPISKSAPFAQRSGEQIVRTSCATCHQTGVGGAPKIGDRAAWIPRLKQGFEVVVRSAIKGHGPMPSRGGVADITDPELRAAIVFMIDGA